MCKSRELFAIAFPRHGGRRRLPGARESRRLVHGAVSFRWRALLLSLSGNSAEAWRVQFSKVPVPPKPEKQQNLWPPSVTVIFLASCTDIESNWMTFFATTSKVLENSLTSLHQTIIWKDRFERESSNSLQIHIRNTECSTKICKTM